MLTDIAEAAKDRQASVVRYILDHSSERTTKTLEKTDEEYNGTALYWVCVNGELDLVSRLLEYGADVNTSNAYMHTPLHAASDMGFTNIVKLLLKYGAKPDLQNQNGQTALHLAAYRGYYEIVEALLKAGADHTIQNSRYLTPLQQSTAMNHIHISALFCTNSNDIPNTRVGTKVVLTRTRSHSPRNLSTGETSHKMSSLPSEHIKRGQMYQDQMRSVFTKRHRSHEHIPIVSEQACTKGTRQQSKKNTHENSTLPSQLRVCQPTEHSYYNTSFSQKQNDS